MRRSGHGVNDPGGRQIAFEKVWSVDGVGPENIRRDGTHATHLLRPAP
jgi:hypothetical protein